MNVTLEDGTLRLVPETPEEASALTAFALDSKDRLLEAAFLRRPMDQGIEVVIAPARLGR